MWIFLFAAVFLCAAGGFLYLAMRLGNFPLLARLAGNRPRARFWRGLLLIAAVTGLLLGLFGAADTVIILIHLTVFWLLFDLLSIPVCRVKGTSAGRTLSGCCALGVTVIYLAIGWYNVHHIVQTNYEITTQKPIGDLRIVQISDSHVGATFDGEGFGEMMERISAAGPDVIVVTGDFVDDSTSREDMVLACQALGNAEATYGVYFIFGNHDKGFFAEERGFSGEDLIRTLEENGVTVLQDESVLIDDRFYLVGRQDRIEESLSGRLTMAEITQGLDLSHYMIVLDHQPCDYAAQEAVKVDLVLSGHTHGGQLFPLNLLNTLVSANEQVYGHEVRGQTHFIVSSGIGNWAMRFKTGCKAEFVVIDILEDPDVIP